jgi:hypothetical protein
MKELKTTQDLKRFLYRFEELRKISRKVHKIDENDCNGYQDFKGNWDERAEKQAEKKKEKLLLRADEISQEFGLKAFHQGDPRGCSLYLIDEVVYKGSSLSELDYMQGIPVF